MKPRTITTSHDAVPCAVCGRTLLRGERPEVFLAGGQRRTVCELCAPRAAHEGWLREDADEGIGVRPRSDRMRWNPSRGQLLTRLRTRRDEGSRPRPRPAAEQVSHPSSPELPGIPEPREVHAVPTNADLKVARAIEVFNGSRHPRTVAGIARSLGTPYAVVRPVAGAGSLMSVVIGWELCWYRYELDLADEASGVRLDGQGDNLSDLDAADLEPNAEVGELGHVAAVQ